MGVCQSHLCLIPFSGCANSTTEHYRGDPSSPLRSPLAFESHADQPPTYLQICGMDPLRDEALIYEDVLKENGVLTKVDLYPGLPHGFWSRWTGADFTREWGQDCIEGLKWLVGSK